MTTIFTPIGVSYAIAYADDSTDVSSELPAASAVLVFNSDTANVVAINFSFVDNDTNANIPVDGGGPGYGTIIGPGQQLTFSIPQAGYAESMFVSVAGVSGTGNVFISLGA
jgi:hypothetical protein